jgi:hypothetical protein
MGALELRGDAVPAESQACACALQESSRTAAPDARPDPCESMRFFAGQEKEGGSETRSGPIIFLDGRRETGDGRRETGDGRRETGFFRRDAFAANGRCVGLPNDLYTQVNPGHGSLRPHMPQTQSSIRVKKVGGLTGVAIFRYRIRGSAECDTLRSS